VDSAGHVLLDTLRVIYSDTGCHTVTEDGDLLYIEDEDKVRKLTSDGTVTTLLTTTHRSAGCIHSSRINGDILVGSIGRVTRYDRTGRELQVIERDDKGQSMYAMPWYITENINGDILTSDMMKQAVVVVDKSGRHRFDYTGRQSVHTDRQSDFDPSGICTDVRGHVLVCDYRNGSVHLLDQDGHFLSLLLTEKQHGIRSPRALCVDDQHNLYLGQYHINTINVYRYLQDTDSK
jgi:sugar lactone lactonase YvrE